MNPMLKAHIETNIDDIEQHNLTGSIIYCPLDIMSDYLDTLRMIDEVIPGHLVPYTRICCCLANHLKGGRMYNMEFRSIGDETYTFQFPVQLMDSQKLRQELTQTCPGFYSTIDIGYGTSEIEIKVSIQHASKFMF